jgi:glutamine amidotransferase
VSVAIIDYGSGNLHSAQKAFERVVQEQGLKIPILVTSDPDVVRKAERIVLPGVGAYADCRRGLAAVAGMVDALNEAVLQKATPFLGICVGMQLMATRGLEHGETAGLNWIEGDVAAITPHDQGLKIPHMGWNSLDIVNPHPLLAGLPMGEQGLHAYFVHSYHMGVKNPAHCVAISEYSGPVTAMIARDTMVGVQFHPEKSQRLGLGLIANFLRWRP